MPGRSGRASFCVHLFSGKAEVNAVDARAVHAILGVKSNFRDLIRNRIEDCGFIEKMDYATVAKNLAKPNGGRPTAEYALRLHMGKILPIVERTPKGKQARPGAQSALTFAAIFFRETPKKEGGTLDTDAGYKGLAFCYTL